MLGGHEGAARGIIHFGLKNNYTTHSESDVPEALLHKPTSQSLGFRGQLLRVWPRLPESVL
ncbi:hypothetical protein A2U01_0009291 [Trifolium medium]|uniref:Uncharacterized protein n=2 Tax=Trifolium TaxID=3898 RepID=A0A2K3LGG8_TRIPR|nr:hypothetical protein [Trifolium medium]PNX77629.1 hypothetical protein L195_g033597 [Trifolium pratense]